MGEQSKLQPHTNWVTALPQDSPSAKTVSGAKNKVPKIINKTLTKIFLINAISQDYQILEDFKR